MTKESTHISIKEWNKDDRPREKMLQQGRRALSDAELLAIIIGSGNKEESAVELSRTMLQHFGNDLDRMQRSEIAYLTQHFRGIGEAKAITILAALELGKRMRMKDKSADNSPLRTSKDLYLAATPYLHGLTSEEVWMFSINKSNRLTQARKICSGGVDSSLIDIKMILHEALLELTPAIAIVHNHPSGNLKPSDSDKASTERLDEACKCCDIVLLDHLIFTDNDYFSFADNGLL